MINTNFEKDKGAIHLFHGGVFEDPDDMDDDGELMIGGSLLGNLFNWGKKLLLPLLPGLLSSGKKAATKFAKSKVKQLGQYAQQRGFDIRQPLQQLQQFAAPIAQRLVQPAAAYARQYQPSRLQFV